jgi:hypothetical protein
MAVDYAELARKSATKYGLFSDVFLRQMRSESGLDPSVVSPAGAIGIAQIMPETAKSWGVNPRDPVASLDVAAKNMANYVRTYGGFNTTDPTKVRGAYEKALQAYNAGPGSVGKYMPGETRNYIQKIVGPDQFSFTEALKNKQGTLPSTSALPQQQQQQKQAGNTFNFYLNPDAFEGDGTTNPGARFLQKWLPTLLKQQKQPDLASQLADVLGQNYYPSTFS